MSRTLYVADAFSDRPFTGNPAAVCVLDAAVDERWMQLVAREMNLAETAFLHPIEGGFSLRWFTPAAEVKLCGHATLASAFVLWETGVLKTNEAARFHTLSGWLTCRQQGGWIEMDFPAIQTEVASAPNGLAMALGVSTSWCGRNGMDYLVEVADEAILRSLAPDLSALAKLEMRGLIVTCQGSTKEFDFLSRFFAPGVGVPEDPVTGSAHCALGPYWMAKLGKAEFTAYQASERGGVVKLTVQGDRVLLRGQAVMMSEVTFRH